MAEIRGPKILIAEDEPDIALILETVLQGQGYAVTVARDGQEAVERARAEPPDVLLLDLMMPKKTGYEVCRELRDDPRFVMLPIIMLTAKSQAADQLLGFEVGADDYVIKPFDPDELGARIRAVLRRRQPAVTPAVGPPGDLSSTGCQAVDRALEGGLPAGMSLLAVGPLGSGKSRFGRTFLAAGMRNGAPGLYLSVDDNPTAVRRELDALLGGGLSEAESQHLFRVVDAYSWCAGGLGGEERFAVTGILELTQLAGVVSDAAAELGQTPRARLGGRQVVDSVTSLLVNFELSAAQRFIAHLARSGGGSGGVSSLFILEEGAVDEQALTNIRYVMDGVLEFRRDGERHLVRAGSMKWRRTSGEWVEVPLA